MELSNICMMVLTPVVVLFFEYVRAINPFIARKSTHILLGLLLLGVKYDLTIRIYILLVAVGTILQTCINPFRFAKKRDLGIISYSFIVGYWAIHMLPYSYLAPFFFADPLAAIVGKLFNTRAWYSNKTIAGSGAAFTISYFSIFGEISIMHRILFAMMITFAEAFGGNMDNACIGLCIFSYYTFLH